MALGNNQVSRGYQRDKPFRDALRLEIGAAPKKLRAVARSLLSRAAKGDVPAAREIADRLDGKVPQGIGGAEDLPAIKGVMWLEPEKS